MQNLRLTEQEQRLLCQLADPDASSPAQDQLGDPVQLSRIILFAKAHGVLSIVGRKLRAHSLEPNRLQPAAAQEWQAFEQQRALLVGQSMLLDHHARRIRQAIEEQAIRTVIVKGPAFASRLYRQPGDRTYTDIDLLTDAEAIPKLNHAMSTLGFSQPNKLWDNSERDQEYKWLLDANRSILIEVHGNLVHYPSLRRCISFGYAEYELAKEIGQSERIADLMVAIVHSACGHKFHRLNMLLDVLQAARRLELTDEKRLEQVVRALGARLEVGVTLGVVGELFQDARLRSLAERFSSQHTTRWGRRLITPKAVLDAQPVTTLPSKLQRHGFRQLQQMKWLRP